jgi:DNA-binding transcriptional MerR regulator
MKVTLATLFSDESRSSELIRLKQFPVSATRETYRTINFWESMGVLDNNRSEATSWRKFDLLEIAWIMVISELKMFGYPIKSVVDLKDQLWKNEGQLMEMYLLSLKAKRPMLLIIQGDGKILLKPSTRITHDTSCSFIVIDISKRMKVFAENDLQNFIVLTTPKRG